MFEMKEDYKLGIESIDIQHAKLFEIGERAFKLLKDKYSLDKYDRIVLILEELKEYTVLHFKCEEEYMKSINYGGLFVQKIEHAKFIETINSVDLTKIDENQDEYLMKVLGIVAEWLSGHIIEKDLEIVAK